MSFDPQTILSADSTLVGTPAKAAVLQDFVFGILARREESALQTMSEGAPIVIESFFLEKDTMTLRIVASDEVHVLPLNDEQYDCICGALYLYKALYNGLGNVQLAEAVFEQLKWRLATPELLPCILNDFDDSVLDMMSDDESIVAYTTEDLKQWKSSGVTLVHKLLRMHDVVFEAEQEITVPTLYPVIVAGSYIIFNTTINYSHTLVCDEATQLLTTQAFELRSDGKASNIVKEDEAGQRWTFTIDGGKYGASVLGTYKELE